MPEILNHKATHLGLDVGATSVKGALIDSTGQVLYLDRINISRGGPRQATGELLDRLQPLYPFEGIETAGVTGRGQELYKGQKGWQAYTSLYAAVAGLRLDHPDAKMIIVIGGGESLVIGLEGKAWRAASPPLCAAGTGRFLEQQASRLGIPIEEFGNLALQWAEKPPRIAARCSVFAKSDLIHLQQKGWPLPAMLAGLSDSVARMIEAQWRNEFESPIYLLGGVAANQGVVRALSSVL